MKIAVKNFEKLSLLEFYINHIYFINLIGMGITHFINRLRYR